MKETAMNNVIIFSNYDLVRFFLKRTIENITMMRPKRGNVAISVCYSLSELENNILTLDNPTIIFDIDDVSKFEQFRLFKIAKGKVNQDRLFLFTSEHEKSGSYTMLMQISSFLLSKTALQSQIEAMFYHLIFRSNNLPKAKVLMQASSSSSDRRERVGLTQRESEVCRHLLSGLSNKDISILLGISNKTVSSHRTNIYSKYQSKNLLELYSRLKV